YLDKKPLVVNRIGFIGNIGWYDYSFHSSSEPMVSNKLTFIRRDTNQEFSWSEISYSDLTSKELWTMDVHQVPTRISVWNDLYYIKWPLHMDDIHFCNTCYETINQHFLDTFDHIDHLVFMSHHALFEKCIVRYPSYQDEFNNAFRGCKFLGDYIISHPKLRKVIFGHTHEAGIYPLGGDIEAINPYYTPEIPFRVISLPY
ncbi:MAG: hypothetical protein PHI40_05050, partial [Caldisericia bacterium]|nr:hypothetical protein [Caldisericia bacterium]